MTPLLLLVAALAQPAFDQGRAVRASDGKAALALIGQAASQGHAPAMFVLSSMLMAGEGGPRDEALARHWLEQAVERDNAEAMQQLALHLQDGSGGYPRDEQRAAQLLRKVAHLLKHQAHGH